jgi:predicted transcriptional regulator
MARRKSKTLTELELRIMQIVWQRREVTVDEIETELEKSGWPLAPSSIRTMLSILSEKGYVSRKQAGRGYAYRAKVSRERARKHIASDVIQRAFDGSALDLVAALLDGKMVRQKELEEVKRLIRRHEKEMNQ